MDKEHHRDDDRKIDIMFRKLFGDPTTNEKGALVEMKEGIDYTNGKVAKIIAWKQQVIGGSKVLFVVVFPMIIWAFMQIRDIDNTVRTSVQEALSVYEIPNK